MAWHLVLTDLFHFVDDGEDRAPGISSVEAVSGLALARGFIGEAGRDIARDSIGMSNG